MQLGVIILESGSNVSKHKYVDTITLVIVLFNFRRRFLNMQERVIYLENIKIS